MFEEKNRVYGMENNVKVASIQIGYTMGDKQATDRKIREKIEEAAANGAKLVVLPETCGASGYVWNTKAEADAVAEPVPGGPTTGQWEKIAKELDVYIVGGLVEKVDYKLYNTAVLIGPEGYIGKYRKMHLWDEDKLWYEPGDLGIPVWTTPIGRIAIIICYDMWFSEMWRICALKGADIVCVPTNWLVIDDFPKEDQTLAPFMAMVAANTNCLFVACADRVGSERGVTFPGRSLVLGPGAAAFPKVMGSPADEEIVYVDCNISDARKYNWCDHTVLFRDRRTDYYDEMLGTDEEKLPF